MKESAGVAIIWKGKILIAHPKGASWYRTYTPPKGGMEKGEALIDAAIRETKEEVGIQVKKKDLLDPIEIPYNNQKGVTYKMVTLFPMLIKQLSEINLKSEKVPLSQLQLEEVDDARFMSPEEFKERVLPRYYEPLKQLIEKYSMK